MNKHLSVTWARSLHPVCRWATHSLMTFWVTAISFLFFLLFRLKLWVLKSQSIVQKFQNRIHLSASWSSRPLQGLQMSVVLGNVLFIVLSGCCVLFAFQQFSSAWYLLLYFSTVSSFCKSYRYRITFLDTPPSKVIWETAYLLSLPVVGLCTVELVILLCAGLCMCVCARAHTHTRAYSHISLSVILNYRLSLFSVY